MRIIVALLSCFCLTNLSGQTNKNFQPFPGDSAEMYKFDLYKNYFINDEVEYKQRTELITGFQNLAKKFDEKTKTGEKNFYPLIYEYDSLGRKIGKHSAYLGMFAYIDLSNPVYYMKMDTFNQQLSPILNRINETITALPSSSITKEKQSQPGPDYHFFYTQLKEAPLNKLPENERRIINDITPNLINWQARLFQTTIRSTELKPVKTGDRVYNLPSNLSEVFNHPDREVRKQGYLNNLEGMMSRRDIFAMLLLETVRNRNQVARLMGFNDFPEQYYSQRFLTKENVRKLLKTLADSAYINKRYENAEFEKLKKSGGIDSVFAWDRFMPDPKAPTPRFTIGEASKIILEATKPLGNEYYIEMAKLLDPQNGRLDMVNRPNRIQRPGFSTGSVGYNSVFFQGNYEGYIGDLIIFGHEAGHAVQNMLMDKNGVSSFYALGPGYFTESFAGFNELLITDYLYQHANTIEYKRYYLSRFLNQAMELFGNAMDATYEQTLYDSVPAGKISNADQLELQMQKTGLQFSNWYQPYIKFEMQWINKLQFISNPMYRLNYVYAKLLALYYFSLYQQNGQSFIQKYNGLLKNGYDSEPDKILKQFLNISITDKKLVDLSLGLINKKIDEYEALQ
ncbi:MAG TPA: M3 family metallopeptidase [Chitinophagaceae bacterium]|nr:M3 family metallopeptidase [Chitinophagaceae bacterium]